MDPEIANRVIKTLVCMCVCARFLKNYYDIQSIDEEFLNKWSICTSENVKQECKQQSKISQRQAGGVTCSV